MMVFSVGLPVLIAVTFAMPSDAGVVITSYKKTMPSSHYQTTTVANRYNNQKSNTPQNYYAAYYEYPATYTKDASKASSSYISKPVKRVVAYNSQSPYVYTTVATYPEEAYEQRYYSNDGEDLYQQSYANTEAPVYEAEAGDYYAPYYTTSPSYQSNENYDSSFYYTTEPYKGPMYSSQDAAYEPEMYSTRTTPYSVIY